MDTKTPAQPLRFRLILLPAVVSDAWVLIALSNAHSLVVDPEADDFGECGDLPTVHIFNPSRVTLDAALIRNIRSFFSKMADMSGRAVVIDKQLLKRMRVIQAAVSTIRSVDCCCSEANYL